VTTGSSRHLINADWWTTICIGPRSWQSCQGVGVYRDLARLLAIDSVAPLWVPQRRRPATMEPHVRSRSRLSPPRPAEGPFFPRGHAADPHRAPQKRVRERPQPSGRGCPPPAGQNEADRGSSAPVVTPHPCGDMARGVSRAISAAGPANRRPVHCTRYRAADWASDAGLDAVIATGPARRGARCATGQSDGREPSSATDSAAGKAAINKAAIRRSLRGGGDRRELHPLWLPCLTRAGEARADDLRPVPLTVWRRDLAGADLYRRGRGA
jgi:hypothetical protein